ncbi:MAG: hypothetical protein O2935_03860 [Proteobacteria bacterium]|nr:hypothetical protein [Pseudomonadota bacterium]
MALVNFTSLDFEDIKTSIKDYIRANSSFTDYDFEGSNLSIIIDTLAYNTYISSYNANMVSNEVFIDSATLRENVISLARNIGYVPRSRQSSTANVSFFIDVSDITVNPPLTLSLQKGIICTPSSSFGGQSFVFSIPENITVPVVTGIAFFENIKIYEGSFITESFVVDPSNLDQKYILNNSNIDTNSIRVFVTESDNGNAKIKYNIEENIIGINSKSRIFFIQEIEDQRYELIFGDGNFGKKLNSSDTIEVSYIVTNGESGNGISNFTFSGRVFDNNNSIITSGLSLITTNLSSRNGKEIESVSSIKKYAPRIYSAQNRAVTSKDYESIIPKIYPQTESVSVFGGEELSPPQYGKVFITIKPISGNFLSTGIKQNIKNDLKKYSVAGIVVEILDLKYLYIEINSKVYYNTNLAPSAEYVSSIIQNNTTKYAESTELNKYGARFKYSKFLKTIDESHESVTSNITTIQMRRDLRVVLNTFTEYQIGFGNEFHIRSMSGFNIKSSALRVSDILQNVYISDLPNSDGKTGSLFLFTVPALNSTTPTIVKRNVGKIDYMQGIITITPINIQAGKIKDGQTIVEFSATPHSNDVIGLRDLYLQLDIGNSNYEMVSDSISSGIDPSASNYITSSSYANGLLIRPTSNIGASAVATPFVTSSLGLSGLSTPSTTSSSTSTQTSSSTPSTSSSSSTTSSTSSSSGSSYSSGY